MSNDWDIAIFVPSVNETTETRLALDALRFRRSYGDGGFPMSGAWLWSGRFSQATEPRSFDDLRDTVLAMPWRRERVPVHIHVMWQDDYTHDDDDMSGRLSPCEWNHEVWVIPPTEQSAVAGPLRQVRGPLGAQARLS